jgi:hypothetical protein
MFYIKTQKQATRSEKKVDLTAIPSTVKEVKESREALTKFKTSIAINELRQFTKDQLLPELSLIKPHMENLERVPHLTKRSKWDVIASTLVDCRKRVFKKKPEVLDQIKRDIARANLAADTTCESRHKELTQEFFSLQECRVENSLKEWMKELKSIKLIM